MKKLFSCVPQWRPSNIDIETYIEKFRDSEFMSNSGGVNKMIPAGYTYLGQFIAHDLSFNLTIPTEVQLQNVEKQNLRTPTLDLDAVYGGGPHAFPFCYDQEINFGRTHFFVDTTKIVLKNKPFWIYDLPRKMHSKNFHVPVIPDGRNDENFILSQLHVAIQLFHNQVVEKILAKRLKDKKLKDQFTIQQFKKAVIRQMPFQKKVHCRKKTKKRNKHRLLNGLIASGKKKQKKSKKTNTFQMKYFVSKEVDIFFKETLEQNEPIIKNQEKEESYRVHSHFYSPTVPQENALDIELKQFSPTYFFYKIKDQKFKKKFKKCIKNCILQQEMSLYDESFMEAQKEVRYHFQWVLLFDYLPKIVGTALMQKLLKQEESGKPKLNKLALSSFFDGTFIPLEFSVAAFRFGHSMVVKEYFFRKNSNPVSIFSAKKPYSLPKEHFLDWSFFFFFNRCNIGENDSMRINPYIQSNMVNNLPVVKASRNIVFRNLERSARSQLSEGQEIARILCKEIIDSDKLICMDERLYKNLEKSFPWGKDEFKEFCDHSPLWFYILMEAAVMSEKGSYLGPLGGQIVAEVILAIMAKDENSIFHADKNWKPKYFNGLSVIKECKNTNPNSKINQMQGDNSMIKLLKFAGVYEGAFVNGKPDWLP